MTTRYVDNRLTSGANDGTTAADAYRSLEHLRAGVAGQTVEIISFVAGSGPYRESFSTRATRFKTDLSFQASDRSLNSVSTDLSTFSFAANDIVQIYGSPLNSKQLTISTVAANKIVFIASNTVLDEAAGNSVCVTSMNTGSNLAALDPGSNGSATTPRRWLFNGCEIDCGRRLDSSNGYSWTASSTSGEWYVRRSDGSNPSLVQPRSATIDGEYISDSADLNKDMGTVGSLSTGQPMGWGDNDSLGYSTVYVKSTDTPGNHTVHVGQVEAGVRTTWQYQSFEDGVFTYGNRNVSDGNGIANGSSTRWDVKRCVFKYQTTQAIEQLGTAATYVESCVSYFSGHRAFYLSANGRLQVLNHLDYGSHLFALIGASMTYAAALIIRNCVSVYNEAGAIDKKSAAAYLEEDHNVWYPRFGAAGAALGYVSTANWATTHATDYPPSAATTIATIAANVSAGAVDPQLTNPSDTSFTLANFKPTNRTAVVANGGPCTDLTDIAGTALHGRSQNPDRGPWFIGGSRPRAVRN